MEAGVHVDRFDNLCRSHTERNSYSCQDNVAVSFKGAAHPKIGGGKKTILGSLLHFIHQGCSAGRCQVLEILAKEMPVFSQI